MQFQNAVITPSGIAIFSAANTNKPIKFTRFLFTDSVTRLTGQEAELPPNTWGNGSVDAVLGQDELQQFVIFASASNAEDYGYARGYGIYAEQEGVEYLVAVANCLGDPTYVSQMSGGYSRFHLALTIKYSVNSNVLTVAPNIGGLITREEFEMWTNRVVTTTSPSGAPYGEDQDIHGVKMFRDNVVIGALGDRRGLMGFADMVWGGSIQPMPIPGVDLTLGVEANPWPDVYCTNLHADYITSKAVMILKGNSFDAITQSGQTVTVPTSQLVSLHRGYRGVGNPEVWAELMCINIYIGSVQGVRTRGLKRIDFAFYFNASEPYTTELQTRGRLILVGKSVNSEANTTQIFESSMKSLRGPVTDGTMHCQIPYWQAIGNDDNLVRLGSVDYIYVELELIR